MMTEAQIFSLLFACIAGSVFFLIIPRALILPLLNKRKNQSDNVPENAPSLPMVFPNWIDIIIIMLLFAVFTTAISSDSGEKSASISSINSMMLVFHLSTQILLSGFICLLLFWRINLDDHFGLNLKKIKWVNFLWCPAIILCVWAVTALIHALGYFRFLENTYGENPLQEVVILLQESDDPVLLSLLVASACIGAPLSEEVLFRGYLYPVLKRYSCRWIAVLLSSLLFAIIHFNLAAMPSLLLMGALLAISFELTKTIWVPIIAHLLFNSATTVIQIGSRFIPELNLQ